METIDTPTQLKFNNGNNFPKNFIFIAYAAGTAAIIIAILGTYLIGAISFFLSLFIMTSRHIVEIDTEKNTVHDYVKYLGFIKIGKKYLLDKYKYITAMPLIESSIAAANLAQTTTITQGYYEINLFGSGLRGKRHITKFESKTQAQEVAEKLADRLQLKFFEYDPKLVRAVLRGERTL